MHARVFSFALDIPFDAEPGAGCAVDGAGVADGAARGGICLARGEGETLVYVEFGPHFFCCGLVILRAWGCWDSWTSSCVCCSCARPGNESGASGWEKRDASS